MAVTLADLKAFVGNTDVGDDAVLGDCLAEAVELVEGYIGANVVPTAVLDRAYKEVASDLFSRRHAPHGIVNQQFATTDGVGYGAVRIARDPLASVYPMLQRWVLPW